MMSFHQPGAMQHPGMAHGQPMPGQVVHQGQPMGQQMMHPGVSAPGGPMVTQGGPMMGGMQPGMGGPGAHGNPNAHAMSHLAGNAQMMQQHGLQQFANQPMSAQQQQQIQRMNMHNMQMRQLQMQQAQQQAQQHGGMPVGFQNNPAMAQQLQAMQGHPMTVQMPPHMQQQQQQQHQAQQQQLAMLNQQRIMQAQQAQAQAQAQAQQAQAQAQAQAHAQQQSMVTQAQSQQAQQAQVQAHLQAQAMQHVNSQSSNHPTPQPMPGHPHPPNAGPVRPGTAMSMSHEARSSPAPQKIQGPPAQPQPSGPQATPATSAQMNQPVPSPAAPPPQAQPQRPNQGIPPHMIQAAQQQQQQANQQQQIQHSQPQPQQGQPQPQPQQPGQMMQQPQQAQALRNAQMQRAALMQRQQNMDLRNACIITLYRFADAVSMFKVGESVNTMEYWSGVVNDYFSEQGAFYLLLPFDTKPKQYQVFNSLIARYFSSQFDESIDQMQLVLEGLTDPASESNGSSITVVAERARMIHHFRGGHGQVVIHGRISSSFISEKGALKMEYLQFEISDHEQFLPRSRVLELCESIASNPAITKSPKMSKKPNPKAVQEKMQEVAKLVPDQPTRSQGITEAHQLWLEMAEAFGLMQEFMAYSKENPELGFDSALDAQVNIQRQQIGQLQQVTNPMLMQQMQPGQKMVNGAVLGQQMTMSPAMQAGMLPNNGMNGSPRVMPGGIPIGHTQSPALSNMAPPMSAQRSQQGTASGASTNTSPNLPSKRRRSTQANIKGEDDTGVNGTTSKKVKPSPQLGKRGK